MAAQETCSALSTSAVGAEDQKQDGSSVEELGRGLGVTATSALYSVCVLKGDEERRNAFNLASKGVNSRSRSTITSSFMSIFLILRQKSDGNLAKLQSYDVSLETLGHVMVHVSGWPNSQLSQTGLRRNQAPKNSTVKIGNFDSIGIQ